MEYKGQNHQGKSFKGQDLQNADFSGSDLRGADFSGALLRTADFTNTKTGLRIPAYILIFVFSLIISLLSGYIAMLTGSTNQFLINHTDGNLRLAGYITTGLFILFVLLSLWKGGTFTLKIVFPVILLVLVLGAILRLTGVATGVGPFQSALALCLLVLMFFVGTVARASAGALSSNIIFLFVAMGGAMFGKSIGGGIGTVVMALACAVISKRALKGAKGFELLKTISLTVSTYFGTSFRLADLTNADFSNSTVINTDFTDSKMEGVNWKNAVKVNTLNDT
ncbi:MAG: pentapeptide repeat-containing protein [Ignavibacteriae bacterium]|nr:pentapeptide repeat-containing protein [Ignavibacteriota bacterium]